MKYWTANTFEISSYKYHLSDRINKSFNTSGSDNTGKCTYTYNSIGFRGDEPNKEGFKVMCIGDSNTEGVGVNNQETWPAQFCKFVNNSVNHNFGMGGRSNDYISRCLLSYYEIIKPDLVLVMYTSPHRREFYTEDGNIEPFIPTSTWGFLNETEKGKRIQLLKTELENDNEDLINWYKNHLLIKYFLEAKKCNWLWNGWFGISTDFNEYNRFDGDYFNFIDTGVDGVHPGPKTHKKYAESLYNIINLKFPVYLNKSINLV